MVLEDGLSNAYVCNFIHAYYTVSFTAQRLFAVIKPFRVSHVLSWYRSRCLVLLIIFVACLIYSYLPFLIGIVNGRCYSLEHLRWINELMDIIDCILVFLIPYLMIITMNTIILLSLRRLKQIEHEFLFQNNSQLFKIHQITRRNASRKMTKLLLTVSTFYLIICAPYACIHTWRLLFRQQNSSPSKLVRQLEYYFHLIYHISFCKINFSHCFRREDLYENDYSSNQNNSANLEQFQLMKENSPCSTLTTDGYASRYK